MSFAHNSFELSAVDGLGDPVTVFDLPLTATFSYLDTDFTAPENTLGLFYWNDTSHGWQDAVTTCPGGQFARSPEINQFSLPVCHLTEFGVFGVPYLTFAPIVQRSSGR